MSWSTSARRTKRIALIWESNKDRVFSEMMPASGVANMKHPCLLGVLALGLLHSSAVAQWMPHPVADMPRKSNGAPDLDAPVSRAADGKPDLSGLWYIRPFAKYHVNFAADF